MSTVLKVGVRKERIILVGPWDYLNRHCPLLDEYLEDYRPWAGELSAVNAIGPLQSRISPTVTL